MGVEANLFCHGFDSLGCHHGSVVTTRYVEILGMTVERMRLSQPIGLILLHCQAPSEPRIPGRSL